MKILVAVKRVVDFNVKVRVKSDCSGVDLANVKMAMNPFDEIAVEEAVRLKEAGVAKEVVVVSIGERSCQDTLRAALASGADRAVLVEHDDALAPLAVAKLLAVVAQREGASLIILGKQSIDQDACQTGQMLAALLDWPQATFASRLTLTVGEAIIEREIDGGLETLKLALPCLVSADLRLNEPRYASMPSVIKARTKPLAVVAAASLGVELQSRIRTLRVDEPPRRTSGMRVNNVQELAASLKQAMKAV
jgi:electron transfer flavoprotein beta subunit